GGAPAETSSSGRNSPRYGNVPPPPEDPGRHLADSERATADRSPTSGAWRHYRVERYLHPEADGEADRGDQRARATPHRPGFARWPLPGTGKRIPNVRC